MYYEHRRPQKDEALELLIEEVLEDNPTYGHKRIALCLERNKKAIKRVMKRYDLHPARRRRKPRKKADEGKAPSKYSNLIKYFCPIAPGVVRVSGFTCIWYKDRFLYLATIMDIFTGEVVGIAISKKHGQELVIAALLDALAKHKASLYLHSGQGAEYEPAAYEQIIRGVLK